MNTGRIRTISLDKREVMHLGSALTVTEVLLLLKECPGQHDIAGK